MVCHLPGGQVANDKWGYLVRMTVKVGPVALLPPAAFTTIGPVEAVFGTVAVIWVEESMVKVAAAPLNSTEVT